MDTPDTPRRCGTCALWEPPSGEADDEGPGLCGWSTRLPVAWRHAPREVTYVIREDGEDCQTYLPRQPPAPDAPAEPFNIDEDDGIAELERANAVMARRQRFTVTFASGKTAYNYGDSVKQRNLEQRIADKAWMADRERILPILRSTAAGVPLYRKHRDLKPL